MDIAAKTRLGAQRIVSKKVAHKAAEATGELIGNKIAEKLWNLLMIQGVKKDFEEIEKKKRKKKYWIN